MKKVLSLAIMVIVALMMSVTTVYAADIGCTVTASADKQALKPGDTITLKFTATDIKGNSGISGIFGTISYDKTIFEAITQNGTTNDIVPQTGWSVNMYDQTNQQLSLTRTTFTKENTDIFTLTLKVKANAVAGQTKVTFTSPKDETGGVQVSIDNQDPVKLGDISYNGINIVTGGASLPTPTQSVVPTQAQIPTTNPTPTQSAIPTSNKTATPSPTKSASTPTNGNTNNTNTTNNKIPKAGTSTVIVPAIVVMALVSVIAYIGYKRMDYK